MLKIHLKQILRYILLFPVSIALLCPVIIHATDFNGKERKQVSLESKDTLDKRAYTVGGKVVIDGSLQVLESNYTKVFDLVETSTPVIAGANHARMFLRADGTKQSLIIEFDDGVFVKIAGN